jgi:hypothetical protein
MERIGIDYTGTMRSVADDLRVESARAIARLTASERIELALRLGDQDVASYLTAHGLTVAEARAALARGRAVGRVPSRSNDASP